ncbi:hypothetical protein [Portibacter lacus]|uniref:Lipoprotein n=1 Tax=Portibacter lacus TaxID=1099794 RepID=A0AA37STP4_9BACT|nr:hypothetical protein [Portibacter lacus]GLR20012.1 hypothetical protein GCM10007940_46280 [Portibacter lacus]
MKKILKFTFLLALSFSLATFTACTDDETCSDGIQNQDETGIDCGGACTACITCEDGIQNGDEEGVDCGGSNCDVCLVGAHGSWESSGDNVAPLLAGFVSKLVTEFNTDGTYTVTQTDLGGAETELKGTYTQSESSVDGIWDIVLNQSSPNQLTATGIFKITDDLMEYEVAQTDPAIAGVTAPTASAGLGSTSGGAFGTTNVQKFVRL